MPALHFAATLISIASLSQFILLLSFIAYIRKQQVATDHTDVKYCSIVAGLKTLSQSSV